MPLRSRRRSATRGSMSTPGPAPGYACLVIRATRSRMSSGCSRALLQRALDHHVAVAAGDREVLHLQAGQRRQRDAAEQSGDRSDLVVEADLDRVRELVVAVVRLVR